MTGMEKTRSTQGTSNTNDDLRNICRQVAPYVCRQWREVCEELGVADATLDRIQTDGRTGTRLSEVTYRGLCAWLDMVGRAGTKDKLLRAVRASGLRRAEDFLQSLGAKRTVPCLARPVTASETPVNNKARQKATLDRLSRPKTAASTEKSKKKTTSQPVNKQNLANLQITPSKPNEICEVKIRITVQGVQRLEDEQMEATRDDFQSTKQDSKHTCHTFVKLVMVDQKAHFAKLKELLGFDGVSVQRLDKVGFNINLFILCFNLGAFETLYQSYKTGRLKHIVKSCLIRPSYLSKVRAKALELSVLMDDQMVNKYRDILLVRGTAGEPLQGSHPIDTLDEPDRDSESHGELKTVNEFNLRNTLDQLETGIDGLQERYDAFNASVNEFLRTLRILRPTNAGTLTCFQDVLDIYFSLRKSSSASHVHKDELEEYIAIVNQIRLKTVFIREHDLEISFDESVSSEGNDLFHKRLADLERMLEANFRFATNTNTYTTKETYTGIEQELFGGVLCYIPDLLSNLSRVCQILQEHVVKPIEDDDKENDINVENSSQVPAKADYLDPPVYDPPENPIATQYLKTWTPPILVTFHE